MGQSTAIETLRTDCPQNDLVCLSHLRWDFVFQRPQHLMTRFAKNRRVFFVEEPIHGDFAEPRMHVSPREDGLVVATPHLPHGTDHYQSMQLQKSLLEDLFLSQKIEDATIWYYTPMALTFSRDLPKKTVIYDCMDELSHFKNAPRELVELENELFDRADLVFTGGHSLYEYKASRHENIHAFPSSIDFKHFSAARGDVKEPLDQVRLRGPKIGFFGVLDERFDSALMAEAARLRPDWQFVLLGPIVKVTPESLPQGPNIHYLGMKSYNELPAYLGHWDCAVLPFALNESTRFISPTKTPEYLAAGKPVVSTAIRDVVRPYGEEGLVRIVGNGEQFVKEAEEAMKERAEDPTWLSRVDSFLSGNSWDQTWARMASLEQELVDADEELDYSDLDEVASTSVITSKERAELQ
jgi:glycosyltransferase involved in cell wall biosynthesis